jgi:SNF2 family DNA or RNA helicase
MNKLLQISSGAVYSDTKEVVEFDCSVRLREMTEMINQSSHKTLVFANFKHAIETIKNHLDEEGISSDIIHGGISAGKRTEIFRRFQQESEPQVLIIQPQAASHGVTLHAANTIVWWGPITSAETYLQANARVYRAGQKNPCTVVHLVGSEIERKLYKALADRTMSQSLLLEMYKKELDIV